MHTNCKINNSHHDDFKLQKKICNNDIVYLKNFQPHDLFYVVKDIKLFNELILNITHDKSKLT